MGRFILILSIILILQYAWVFTTIAQDIMHDTTSFKSKTRFIIWFIPFGFLILMAMDLIIYFKTIK